MQSDLHELPLLMREKQLLSDCVPVSRATLWDWVAKGRFPKPVRLSRGAVAWRREDYIDWYLERRPIKKDDFLHIDAVQRESA